MKKRLASIAVLLILVSAWSQPVQAVVSITSAGQWPGTIDQQRTTPFEYEFLAPSARWTDWVFGQAPATFSESKIQYQLADGVIQVDSQVTDRLATASQLMGGDEAPALRPDKIVAAGGYVPKAVLDQAAQSRGREIKNGTVVVDPASGTAFKVVSPTTFSGAFAADEGLGELVKPLANTYGVARPQLSEVVKSFELQEETIQLTRGNISGFAPNIEKNLILPGLVTPQAFNDALKDFKYLSSDPLIKLQFTDQELEASLGNGQAVNVVVSGGLGIDQIDLTGRYSGFSGYKIAITLKQESYLVVEMDASVKSEVRIPILGLDIPFGIGRVSGGIFAIVGLDGSLRLEIEARDYTETTLGVRGSTKFYVPTSVHPIFNQKFSSDGEVDLYGDIDGYLKFGPMLGLELFGFDLVGAGVFLGAGVQVQTDQKMLDVHLYGVFNVYVKLAGESYSLANYHPTILRRRQANTAGFRVKVLEAFVLPGRVGGTLEKEGTQPLTFDPAAGISYRVLVVPEGIAFDPNDPQAPDLPEVRKYPATGYATTNDQGEFIQKDEQMLYARDQVFVEFRYQDQAYFSNPVSPTLPFEDFTISAADYYNDFVTGQVSPIRVINWEAAADAPPEAQYEWAYCDGGLISVNPYLDHNYALHQPTGGQARTYTDGYGHFDTRNLLVSIVTGQPIPQTGFDVFDTPDTWGTRGGFDLALKYHDAVTTQAVSCRTTMAMSFSRTIEEVPDSRQTYEENGQIINQVQYDESVWIVNPNGTRTVTSDEFRYNRIVFSTQDYFETEFDYAKADNRTKSYQWQFGEGGKILIPLLDSQGNETGAALFKERVTVEWVWQGHPNPVTITSADHTTVNQQGGIFQVTATGYKPFKFVLLGAPSGVKIDKAGGQLLVPASLAPGDYVFTIRAEEDRSNLFLNFKMADPYDGHDPSPPAEQVFTLTVSSEPGTRATTELTLPSATTQPTTQGTIEATTEPTEPTEPERTAPEIADAEHDYQFVKFTNSGEYTVQIEATGSEPMAWSLEQRSERYLIPEGIQIDSETGELTFYSGIDPGTYYFVIRASNDVGSDTQAASVEVLELIQPTLPPIELPRLPVPRMSGFFSPTVQPVATLGKLKPAQLPFIQFPDLLFDPFDQPLPQLPAGPPNAVTIRYDDPKDIYTTDRESVEGSVFVHWHAAPGVGVALDSGAGTLIVDEAPRCDNYHYFPPGQVPDSILQALQDAIREQSQQVPAGDVFLGESFDRQELIDSLDQLVVNPLGEATYLEYGSLLQELAADPGGEFEVDLNEQTGTFVVGDYFLGLQKQAKASLAFNQPGATITFTGGSLQTDADTALALYNFSFSAGAPHQAEILAAAGLSAGAADSFVYSFGYHGALPGVATFNIDTDLAEGQKVNVYRFDAGEATGSGAAAFTLIAGNIPVGAQGAVVYRNNTMSEYLITTKWLEGAHVSDLAGRPGHLGRTSPLVWWGLGLAALLAGGAGYWGAKQYRIKKKPVL